MNTKKQINLILVYINPKSESASKIRIRRNFFTAIGQLKEQLYIYIIMVVGDFNRVDSMYDKPINIKQNYDKQTSEKWEDIKIDNKWTGLEENFTEYTKYDRNILQKQLFAIELQEIQGYIRTRIPNFERKEPSIKLYSDLERKKSQKDLISSLKDENGDEKSETKELLNIPERFSAKLYKKEITDKHIQKIILGKNTEVLKKGKNIIWKKQSH